MLAGLASLITLLSAVPPASADFHFMAIREVYPGAANDSYVMLQMYSAGQNNLNGHQIRVYGPTGTTITTHTFSGGTIGSGQNQSTILVADDGYGVTFPGPGNPSPDRTDATLDIPAAGGAVCFLTVDCVSWGNFTGSITPSAGTPAAAAGVTASKALRRTITGGSCTGQLDSGDDGNNSAAEFVEVDPKPRSSASTIVETSCSAPSGPSTTIGTKPALKTKSQTAEFTFTSSPPGASFQCRLDAEAFAACTSPKSYAGPLSAASHTFEVKGSNVNGTGPTATYTWEIDLTAPTTTISNPKPPTPNSGSSLTFKYSSSESGSTFQCSLAKVGDPDGYSSCSASGSGKTYSSLTNGDYVFKVRSTDLAGNEGAPAEYPFTVDTSLKDTTAPETSITGKPSDPSNSTTAAFTYQSTEAGSTFQCKMDAEAFSACPPEGKAYTGLAEGQHTFQVRATDTSGNTDASPAGASFSIVLPVAPPEVVPPTTPPVCLPAVWSVGSLRAG